jgi:hypothetical protein
VALVITDVSEELSASFIRVTRIGELGTTLAVTSNRRTLRRICRHLRENLMSYKTLLVPILAEVSCYESSTCTYLSRTSYWEIFLCELGSLKENKLETHC